MTALFLWLSPFIVNTPQVPPLLIVDPARSPANIWPRVCMLRSEKYEVRLIARLHESAQRLLSVQSVGVDEIDTAVSNDFTPLLQQLTLR